MMMNYTLILLAFIAGFMVVAGVNLLLFDLADDRRRQLRQKLADESRLRQAERARNAMGNHELYELTAEGFAEPDLQIGMIEKLRQAITQAGINAHPGQILLMAIGLAIGATRGFDGSVQFANSPATRPSLSSSVM